MAPEQLKDEPVTRRTDVYAASMMLWEVLTGERLFAASNEGAIVAKVLEGNVPRPSTLMDDVPRTLDEVVMKGLSRDPAARFATAREMALALERALPPAPSHAVGDWVDATTGEVLRERAARIARIEAAAETSPVHAQRPRYEVTVSHLFTAASAPASPAPGRTRSLITAAASPVALSGGAQAPRLAVVTAPPARTSTEQMSALNVASQAKPTERSGEETRREQRRRTRWAAGVALVLSAATTVVVGLVAVVATHREPDDRPDEQLTGATPAAAAASSTADAVAAPATPEPSAAAPATTTPAPSAPPPRPSSVARPPRPAAGAPAGSAGAAKPDCNPPYTEDASGRRRVKRECL
jgi:serine/threonine-protein kinase